MAIKKRLLILAGSLMAIAAVTTTIVATNSNDEKSLLAQNVEALASIESSQCYNGGQGASSCSIDGGIDIAGSGVSAACSVSCKEDYYACCSLRCTCVSE